VKREKRGSARRELIAIQKRLWRRLRREIQSSLDEQPGNVAIYLEEYERELADFQSPATRDDLLASALSADIVYVGDYHTLRQSRSRWSTRRSSRRSMRGSRERSTTRS